MPTQAAKRSREHRATTPSTFASFSEGVYTVLRREARSDGNHPYLFFRVEAQA